MDTVDSTQMPLAGCGCKPISDKHLSQDLAVRVGSNRGLLCLGGLGEMYETGKTGCGGVGRRLGQTAKICSANVFTKTLAHATDSMVRAPHPVRHHHLRICLARGQRRSGIPLMPAAASHAITTRLHTSYSPARSCNPTSVQTVRAVTSGDCN